MKNPVRQDVLGWVWVTLGAVAALALPVWGIVTAVVIQLSPDLAGVHQPEVLIDGTPAPGPSLWFVLWRGSTMALRTLSWAALPAGLLLVGSVVVSVVQSRQRRAERAELDAEVSPDAVVRDARVEVAGTELSPLLPDDRPEPEVPAPAPPGEVAADPWVRAGARLIDFGLYELTLLPFQIAIYRAALRYQLHAFETQLGDVVVTPPGLDSVGIASVAEMTTGLYVSLPLQLALGIVQLVLLVNGRTVGKWLLGLRIAGQDAAHAGWERTLLLREVVYNIVQVLLPVVGWLVMPLVNVALLFGEERRTLRDLLAGTTVIQARKAGTDP